MLRMYHPAPWHRSLVDFQSAATTKMTAKHPMQNTANQFDKSANATMLRSVRIRVVRGRKAQAALGLSAPSSHVKTADQANEGD